MSAQGGPIVYTETEIRSYLPSGWGIVPGAAGRRDAQSGAWSIEVLDGADNTWKVEVDPKSAVGTGRLEALRESVNRLERKALGRKSVISG